MTVLVSIFGLWLIVSEIQYFFQENYVYKFVPDTDYESRLPINIDITVASTCDSKYYFMFKMKYFSLPFK